MSYIVNKQYKIAVAGTGYVGLSIATLLSQHHEVVAIDIVPEKVDLINNKKSPIQDDYIEEYLASHKLNLKATLDAEMAYKDADFVVIEGCKAGGHLGFAEDDLLAGKCQTLDDILPEVLAEVKPFEAQFGHSIPVFVAGGVYTGADMAHFTAMGAAGVQLATRFITTYECDASQGYKDVLLNARPENVRIIHSPVGMPGRALNTPLVQALAEGTRFPPRHCARCLKTCDPAKVPYCITHALIEAVKGNVEEGLFFCGANVGRLDRMRTVQELMDELVTEWRQNQ